MAVMLAGCNPSIVKTVEKILKPDCCCFKPSPCLGLYQRFHFRDSGPSLTALPILAEEKLVGQDEKDEGVIGAVKSLFDPNEKTKSGKVSRFIGERP
ncbi:photosystem II D1 precursor processing protein PSB27-H2 chloroplastic isoform X1 [Tripterygium wilfordii]|uniref:Photosystem II D1 processing protein PSB27-H2 chloroplastic isoform X1 n=1 Tax=Tripterygium wilfordii TaxID=458696 RepID=A0A7J7E156_TRIWF|nr:photosystem II D1 precursor processing protein PSB27-H2 chloroplastic isoform X1 [Tripterygium wilfordii]